jgi:uncharacterized membrane-anchored protein
MALENCWTVWILFSVVSQHNMKKGKKGAGGKSRAKLLLFSHVYLFMWILIYLVPILGPGSIYYLLMPVNLSWLNNAFTDLKNAILKEKIYEVGKSM